MNRPTLPSLPRLHGTLALLALFALLAVAGAAYHGLRLRAETLGAYHDVARNLVRVGERELTGTLTLVERTLASRSGHWNTLAASAGGDDRLREDISQLPALRSLSLVDAKGRILASSTPGLRGRQLPPDALAALARPQGVSVQISGPWTGRDLGDGTVTGAPVDTRRSPYFFTLARQSQEQDPGRTLWMVAALNPDFFVSFLSAVAERPEFAVDLYRYDGILLTSTQAGGHAPGTSAAAHPVFREWLPEREFGLIDPDLSSGPEQILSFRASRRYPVVLQARLPHEAVLAGWRTEVQHLTQGTAAALLCVILLTWLLYRQQRRREAAEAVIRAEIELAAHVFAASYDGILITDGATRILRVNAAFTQMTGYTQDEVLGQTPRLLSSGQHDASFYAGLWETVRTRGQWEGEIVNKRKNGEHFPERLAISTVLDAQGKVAHYIGTFADIIDKAQ